MFRCIDTASQTSESCPELVLYTATAFKYTRELVAPVRLRNSDSTVDKASIVAREGLIELNGRCQMVGCTVNSWAFVGAGFELVKANVTH